MDACCCDFVRRTQDLLILICRTHVISDIGRRVDCRHDEESIQLRDDGCERTRTFDKVIYLRCPVEETVSRREGYPFGHIARACKSDRRGSEMIGEGSKAYSCALFRERSSPRFLVDRLGPSPLISTVSEAQIIDSGLGDSRGIHTF